MCLVRCHLRPTRVLHCAILHPFGFWLERDISPASSQKGLSRVGHERQLTTPTQASLFKNHVPSREKLNSWSNS